MPDFVPGAHIKMPAISDSMETGLQIRIVISNTPIIKMANFPIYVILEIKTSICIGNGQKYLNHDL